MAVHVDVPTRASTTEVTPAAEESKPAAPDPAVLGLLVFSVGGTALGTSLLGQTFVAAVSGAFTGFW